MGGLMMMGGSVVMSGRFMMMLARLMLRLGHGSSPNRYVNQRPGRSRESALRL
jgi:hypothetical protein